MKKIMYLIPLLLLLPSATVFATDKIVKYGYKGCLKKLKSIFITTKNNSKF